MQIHLQSIGCRLNEAELERWADEFRGAGHRIQHLAGESEVIVFNTCAVTQQAVRNSRQAIRRLQRSTPAAKLVVSGCYASLQPEEAAELGVDLVVHNRDKSQLVEIAKRELNLPTMPEAATQPAEAALFARGRQRAFIKIQDGCRYRCSFCIVTVARGEERSRSVADIVAEIDRLVAGGVREAVLTGVHVGGYGSDIGSDLGQLIATILRDTDLPRLRLASVEPWDLPPDFFALFENPRLMPHMHLPLQSGCDSVLRRMSRRCKTADFRQLIETARAEIKDFNVTTDIIVGFPGETEQEWRSSLDYIATIGFGHCHIFSYSPRAGTKAARLPDPVDKQTKRARSQALHTLAEKMQRATYSQYLGRRFTVLIEGEGQALSAGGKRYQAYTPNYLRVLIDAPESPSLCNQIVTVQLDRLDLEGRCHASLCTADPCVADSRESQKTA